MPLGLQLHEITISFGGLIALNNVSVDFPAGTISGLIGPNGSGKSTLVNMVSGQIVPDAGKVFLGEQAISGVRPDRIASMGLARTYQVPRVPPELTIAEVIGVPLAYVRRQGALRQRLGSAAAISEFCGLAAPLDTPCSELSVTDLRRLEVARALACAPDVILLDEVMAGLPPQNAEEAVEMVRRIHQAGITVIVIEHMMRVIDDLCEWVVVLNQGQLLATGAPREVLLRPEVQEAYLGKEFAL